jgi:glycosyltransferase involved in cell wall biosynthesis
MFQPLVTFGLVAYKQERFIREAVAGALSQTYSPLETILSDDCSPDTTFQIMKEAVAGYHGPHKVILNRNPRQLGVGGHINRLMEMARGEFIVIAAGDDISVPERTERLYREYAASEGKAMAVFSDVIEIDAAGKHLRNFDTLPAPGFDNPVQMCSQMLRGITGASNSWHRKVFDVFGPLLSGLVFEDRVIALRAALLGRIEHVSEPLVYYRRHKANTVQMFHSGKLADARRTIECFLCAYRNSAQDLEKFMREIQPGFPQGRRCRRIIQRRTHKLESYLQIHSGDPGKMSRGLLTLAVNGGNFWQGARLFLRVLRSRAASSHAGPR